MTSQSNLQSPISKICLINGDGVGQEVIPAAAEVLSALGLGFEFIEAHAGFEHFKQSGDAIPDATLAEVAACGGTQLPAALVERALAARGDDFAAFDDARLRFEREYLTRILRITDGNLTQAARLAKRNRGDFHSLLVRHALDAAAFKPEKA